LIFIQTPVHITVEPSHVLGHTTRAMYGACMEDVNHEVYGGIYSQRIFGESFEEPPPGTSPRGWLRLGGEWSPGATGIICSRGGGGPKLVREMPDLGDGTIETQIRLSNDLGDNAGLLVRVSKAGVGADDFDGYEISLSSKSRQIILGRHRHDFHLLKSVEAPVGSSRWHRLRVNLLGARIRVFLDDETAPRIDFTDDQPLGPGKVALRNWNADAEYRDVRINEETAPMSLAAEGVSRLWDRVATGEARARFAVEEGAYNGTLCQRIEHLGGSGRAGVANRGLNRWGISVRQGHAMEGRIYLRGDVGSATVALQSADGARTYATQHLTLGPNWTKARFQLKSSATDPSARFAIWIDRPGNLWADQAVLLDAPQDRFQGLPVRRDIAETLLKTGINFVRYGGTMVNVAGYRWKSMIGDPDRRPPYAGNWYPSATNGFGIFDFLNFCERAKLGSAFAINIDETPEDAADLADYLTAPVSNPWGRRRASDGHPAPYHPDYIEIGNEEAIANTDPTAVAHYADRFRLLARAIHSRNPKLKLVCSAWWTADSPQMKSVFEAVEHEAAAWDFHFWSDEPNAGTSIDRDLDRAEHLFKTWNPQTTLKVVVFEENGNRHDMQRALGHATTLNATRRHGDFVLADCTANALQPLHQNDNGWDQGTVFFTPDQAWPMPPGDVQGLLAADALPVRVAVNAVEDLDTYASKSEDGRTVTLTVVNTSNHPVQANLSFRDFPYGPIRARVFSGELRATNTPNHKGSSSHEMTFRVGDTITLPTHSVASFRCTR